MSFEQSCSSIHIQHHLQTNSTISREVPGSTDFVCGCNNFFLLLTLLLGLLSYLSCGRGIFSLEQTSIPNSPVSCLMSKSCVYYAGGGRKGDIVSQTAREWKSCQKLLFLFLAVVSVVRIHDVGEEVVAFTRVVVLAI